MSMLAFVEVEEDLNEVLLFLSSPTEELWLKCATFLQPGCVISMRFGPTHKSFGTTCVLKLGLPSYFDLCLPGQTYVCF